MIYKGTTPLGMANVTIGSSTGGGGSGVTVTDPGTWSTTGTGYSYSCYYDYDYSYEGYMPNASWPTITALRTTYSDSYASAYLVITNAGQASTSLSGATAYRCSDAPSTLITASETHTWANTNDLTTTDGKKYRWIIYYFSSTSVSLSTVGYIPLDALYVVFDACTLTSITCFCQSNTTNALTCLESFDFINNAKIASTITNFSYFCSCCYSLLGLPSGLDTSEGTNFSYFCSYCYSLLGLPSGLATSKGTNFSYFCAYCYSLQGLPSGLATSNGTDFSYFCRYCYSLLGLPSGLATSKGTNFSYFCYYCYSLQGLPSGLATSKGTSFSNFCSCCYSLKSIPSPLNVTLDTSTTFASFLSNCYSLSNGYISNLKLALTISTCTFLSHDFILNTFNNLATVSSKTLTLGSTNLAKMTAAEKLIATNKGWTLA